MKDSKHKIINLCSPYRARAENQADRELEIEENLDLVRRACRKLAESGHLPLAPHAYFTQFLDDDNEEHRKLGMSLGEKWLEQADELWVIGNRITAGMSGEIKKAVQLGIKVRFMHDFLSDPEDVI